MLPRIRAITSPTRSEKASNETAPIAIHTQTDIRHHLQRQAASSFPPGLFPNEGRSRCTCGGPRSAIPTTTEAPLQRFLKGGGNSILVCGRGVVDVTGQEPSLGRLAENATEETLVNISRRPRSPSGRSQLDRDVIDSGERRFDPRVVECVLRQLPPPDAGVDRLRLVAREDVSRARC